MLTCIPAAAATELGNKGVIVPGILLLFANWRISNWLILLIDINTLNPLLINIDLIQYLSFVHTLKQVLTEISFCHYPFTMDSSIRLPPSITVVLILLVADMSNLETYV